MLHNGIHMFFFRWHRDGMLKLDDNDSVDGHSKGTLRSLDIDQPTYVGGLPHRQEGKLGNLTQIAQNLGMRTLTGKRKKRRKFLIASM